MSHRPRPSRVTFGWILPLVLLGACATASAPGTTTPHGEPPTVRTAPVEGRDFVVYRSDGAPASVKELLADLSGVDVILIGEEHDDPVTHGVELLLLERGLAEYQQDRPVLLSLEMFERDVQGILDEYLQGLITEDHFQASARPWDNYEPDYRPLVEFARAHGLAVVAANAPRRYVNRASRLGRESLADLSPRALRYLPPLPYPDASAAYQAQWDSLMGDAAQHMTGSPLDGQTLWDATMAHSIARSLDRTPGALVMHVAGGFHVEKGTGIPEALAHYRPWVRVLAVAARPVDDPQAFGDQAGLGDYIVLTRKPPRARRPTSGREARRPVP